MRTMAPGVEKVARVVREGTTGLCGVVLGCAGLCGCNTTQSGDARERLTFFSLRDVAREKTRKHMALALKRLVGSTAGRLQNHIFRTGRLP